MKYVFVQLQVILAQLQDLPAWVQFPDTERVEWLNKVCFQLSKVVLLFIKALLFSTNSYTIT